MSSFEALYQKNSLPYSPVPIILEPSESTYRKNFTPDKTSEDVISESPGTMDISELMDQIDLENSKAPKKSRKKKPTPEIKSIHGVPFTDWSKVAVITTPIAKRPSLKRSSSHSEVISETASHVSSNFSVASSSNVATVEEISKWEQYKYPIMVGGSLLLIILGIQVISTKSSQQQRTQYPPGYYPR